MVSKIISDLITNLISRGLVVLKGYLTKRRVGKLEQQVSSLKDKIKILEHEKIVEKKIQDWKYRVKHKENGSLAEELNKIRNE
jgi:hypothetical protein|tara:strand:- start:767 stop:1015 length:249 start_codon:yes stop_codon:yes gene_type:complete